MIVAERGSPLRLARSWKHLGLRVQDLSLTDTVGENLQ